MKSAIHILRSASGLQMNSFIVTTEDGKIILIDGGFRDDAAGLLNYLCQITAQDIPHIDAWFLTHPHADHIGAFLEIIEKFPDSLIFDKLYFNFPSEHYLSLDDRHAVELLCEFNAKLPLFADRIALCSGGDRFRIGDTAVTILYTYDFEITENVCNNSSLVFKLELAGKSAIFLGDCGIEAGEKIMRIWGDSGLLKSDICQMAHHGQNGCDRSLYAAILPEICLWCAPEWLWNNDNGKGYDTHIWKTVRVREWMDELGAMVHYVIKDGTQVCEID